MLIHIENLPLATKGGRECRVLLDLQDGKNILRSDPLSRVDAKTLEMELKRRIFECQEGARAGWRDRE